VRTVLERRQQGKNAIELVIEDKRRKYGIICSVKRTGTRLVKLALMKTETGPYKGRIQRREKIPVWQTMHL